MPNKCTPCEAGAIPLDEDASEARLGALKGWEIVRDENVMKLKKRYRFRHFTETIAFVDRIAELTESEGHHPVMLVEFRVLTVWWWTHKIQGLHENDFIMAAACDTLPGSAR